MVEISPTAKPPVCRIVDFGKYLYTLEKEEKQAKKKQHVIQLKEIKISSKIKEHDYQTKLRHAIEFLERGDKVKLTMFFRGRELAHIDLGRAILDRFTEDLNDLAEVEKNSGLEGRFIVIHFNAKASAVKKKTQPHTQNAKTEDKQID